MKERRSSEKCKISAGVDHSEQPYGVPLSYIVKESDGSKTMVVNRAIKNPSVTKDNNSK